MEDSGFFPVVKIHFGIQNIYIVTFRNMVERKDRGRSHLFLSEINRNGAHPLTREKD